MQAIPKKELSLFDATCLIAGIIIGVGIYQTAPDVARGAGTWWAVLAIWAVGGLISLFGALGYAELASTYPQEGGDYVYLSRAYGSWAGFLFGWINLAVIRPGDIAVIAFAFATYARALHDPLAGTGFPHMHQIYAVSAVIVLTFINILGVRKGKWTQNVLTITKGLGLLAIVCVAFFARGGARSEVNVEGFPLSVAMILVLFTFGGWKEMAYVAAEVKNPNRNIVCALVLGTVVVTALYLLANGAFLYALGFKGVATSHAVANDAISAVFPRVAGRLISALICVSALGVINGLIFAGSRISYAVGLEHRGFKALGKWDHRTGTPVRALLVQAAISVCLILVLGSFVDTIIYTAAPVYTFYLATSLAVIVLRHKEPGARRPYRVTGYPVTTLAFSAVCAFLVYSAVVYKPAVAIASVGLLALGLPIYYFTNRGSEPRN